VVGLDVVAMLGKNGRPSNRGKAEHSNSKNANLGDSLGEQKNAGKREKRKHIASRTGVNTQVIKESGNHSAKRADPL